MKNAEKKKTSQDASIYIFKKKEESEEKRILNRKQGKKKGKLKEREIKEKGR